MTKIDRDKIAQLQSELIRKVDWGSVEGWHSSMFSELSDLVFDKTGIRLSAATLKRFFGIIKYEGVPSITTLDALSQYVDFENWREYKLSSTNVFSNLKEGFSHKIIYGILGFFAALVFVIMIANRNPEVPIVSAEGVTFSSKNVTNSYPNSVVFDFDLKSITSENIQIQQYWDPTKTIDIQQDQNQATGIYYYPGYFKAKLLVDKQIIKQHDLFLRSNGWIGTIEYAPIPKYYKPTSDQSAILQFPSELEEEVMTSEKPLTTSYHYINDLGNISGDNFVLNAQLHSTYTEKWAICQSSQIYIIGTDGAMIIPFSKLGCSSDNNLMLNDIYKSGKENDLSVFGVDLSVSTQIQLVNEDQTLSIFIEGKKVHSQSYLETMGKFVGLRFKFEGIGEVEHFELLDQNGIKVEL